MLKLSHLVFYFCEKNASIEQTPKRFMKRVQALAEMGYDGVELMVRDALAVNGEDLNQGFKNNGIGVGAIGSGKIFTQDQLCFSSTEKNVRKAAVERIKQHINLSLQIGSPPIVLGSVRGNALHDKAQDWLHIKHCLKECALYAAQKNTKLALEPMEQAETPFINTVQQALEMIAEVGVPSLGLTLDNCNMQAEERDVSAAIAMAKDCIYHVQIADIKRYFPSYTSYDVTPFVKSIYQAGYQGYVSVEPCEYMDSALKDAALGLHYLRNIRHYK